MSLSIDQQIAALSRRVERMLTEQDLRRKLEASAKTGRPLRIKYGMDPTAPDVTLGHSVQLRIIRQFQEWGHKAVIIIGDYTARVGDPSGRNTTRPVLTGEEIDANAKTYVAQISKILLTDPQHLEVRYNGEWLAKMSLVDIIKLSARKTVAQVLTREDFAKRHAEGVDIRLHEILYPLLQGWDSVAIDADVEMGGSDQLFNCLVGREFQKEDGKDGQVVFVTPILVGTDGAMKMYYQLLTDIPADEYKQLIAQRPRDAKVTLAKHIITWLHSKEAADNAEAEFVRQFVKHEVPTEMPEVSVGEMGSGPHRIATLLVKAGLAPSNSEANRKVKEGAVTVDGAKVAEPGATYTVDKPLVLKLGRKYARIVP
jgi:tyrosyl-tRNA synthetase